MKRILFTVFGVLLSVALSAQQFEPMEYDQLTGTPLYITVGSQERSLDAIKWMATEILKAGGIVEFDTLTGCDHPKACNKAFTAKRLKWLFEQK